MVLILYAENDNRISLKGLKNEATGLFVNTATVTCQLYDKTNNVIGTAVTMTYVNASNGDYAGTIEDTIAFGSNTNITAHIMVDAGSGLKASWRVPCQVQVRQF